METISKNRKTRNIYSLFYISPIIGFCYRPVDIKRYLDQKKEMLTFQHDLGNKKLIASALHDTEKYNISIEDMCIIARDATLARETYMKSCRVKRVTRRDNRKSMNGLGVGNLASVRYPRKKRQLKQWKNFYNLFPELAILDNWDGKTSDKMK